MKFCTYIHFVDEQFDSTSVVTAIQPTRVLCLNGNKRGRDEGGWRKMKG